MLMEFTLADLKALYATLAVRMMAERDALCALDGLIGDADHGIAMEQGMAAASEAVQKLDPDVTLQEGFNAAAKAFLNAVGASSGPLYATAFLRAGKVAGPRQSMPRDEVRQVIAAMSEGIAQRGKAEPGQKTMLDAWHPAAVSAAAGASPQEIYNAATSGAEATASMVAKMGRASRLGERSIGFKDPGAVSAAMIVEVLANSMA